MSFFASIKSDLLDFVQTISDDTTKTLSKLAGEIDEEEEELTIRDKMLTDIRRAYETYSLPINEKFIKEYDKYLKSFQLSSYAKDISTVLDEENDVSRYYAELVPTVIQPEEFWSRYFFRVVLFHRGGVVSLDDEYDDEDLAWESADKPADTATTATTTAAASNGNNNIQSNGNTAILLKQKDDEIAALRDECDRLRNLVGKLEYTISELQSDAIKQHQPQRDDLLPVAISAVVEHNVGDGDEEVSSPKDGKLESVESYCVIESLPNEEVDDSAEAVVGDDNLNDLADSVQEKATLSQNLQKSTISPTTVTPAALLDTFDVDEDDLEWS